MAQTELIFQPGVILHDSIVGAFRASGRSFGAYCTQNGICGQTARQATFGQQAGPKGAALLLRIIEAAGPDLVMASYKYRMAQEAAKLALHNAQAA